MTITPAGESFRLELLGLNGAGAAALFKLVELQRMLQMLQAEVAKAGWLLSPAKPQTSAEPVTADPKPFRH